MRLIGSTGRSWKRWEPVDEWAASSLTSWDVHVGGRSGPPSSVSPLPRRGCRGSSARPGEQPKQRGMADPQPACRCGMGDHACLHGGEQRDPALGKPRPRCHRRPTDRAPKVVQAIRCATHFGYAGRPLQLSGVRPGGIRPQVGALRGMSLQPATRNAFCVCLQPRGD